MRNSTHVHSTFDCWTVRPDSASKSIPSYVHDTAVSLFDYLLPSFKVGGNLQPKGLDDSAVAGLTIEKNSTYL